VMACSINNRQTDGDISSRLPGSSCSTLSCITTQSVCITSGARKVALPRHVAFTLLRVSYADSGDVADIPKIPPPAIPRTQGIHYVYAESRARARTFDYITSAYFGFVFAAEWPWPYLSPDSHLAWALIAKSRAIDTQPIAARLRIT
jgi:hypothetical protein